MNTIENYFKKIWTNINPNCKLSFFIGIISGFFIHMYAFTNHLINHDSLYNYATPQDMFMYGRCFLKYACGISSYIDLHWVNGALSIVYLAIICGLLTSIFQLRSKTLCIFMSTFILAFPGVTSVFSYLYAADGYFLAMLCTVLAVYFMTRFDNSWKFFPLTVALFVFSLGTYQAYISVGILTLFIWYLLGILLKQFPDEKRLFFHILKSCLTLVSSIIIYYVCFQLVLYKKGAELSSYQNMNSMGITFRNFYELLSIMKRCLIETIQFLTGTNGSGRIRINSFSYILYFFIALFFMHLFIQNKIYRNKLHLLYLLLLFILTPSVCYIYYFISDTVTYHMLMKMSFFLIFILGLLLADKIDFTSPLQIGICLIFLGTFALITGQYAIDDNLAYQALNQSYEKSYGLAVRLIDRIEQLEEYNSGDTVHLATIGSPDNTSYKDISIDDALPEITGIESGLIYFEQYHYVTFFEQYLGIPCTSATEQELSSIMTSSEYQTMGIWPASDSVRMIEDTIVIRFE